jgi:hypothetical protein
MVANKAADPTHSALMPADKEKVAAVPPPSKGSASGDSTDKLIVTTSDFTKDIASPSPATTSYSLPENCALIKPNNDVVAVVICAPPPEGFWAKLAPNVPSIFIALCAIGLSWFSISYTRGKDDRARKQSIQDDFWLRKVISPVSIEPFMGFMTQLLASLPDSSTPVTDGKKYCEDKLREIRSLMSAFETIRLIDQKLLEEVSPHLEVVEDQLAVYFGQLNQYWDAGGVAPSRPAVVENLTASLTNVLGPIKEHQANVGEVSIQKKWFCQ